MHFTGEGTHARQSIETSSHMESDFNLILNETFTLVVSSDSIFIIISNEKILPLFTPQNLESKSYCFLCVLALIIM